MRDGVYEPLSDDPAHNRFLRDCAQICFSSRSLSRVTVISVAPASECENKSPSGTSSGALGRRDFVRECAPRVHRDVLNDAGARPVLEL